MQELTITETQSVTPKRSYQKEKPFNYPNAFIIAISLALIAYVFYPRKKG